MSPTARPGTSAFAAALAATTDTAAFVARCADRLAVSPFVRFRPEALPPLVPVVRATTPAGWEWYLRQPDGPLVDVLFDFAFNAALNGGYFQLAPDGAIVQWQERGSGSAALVTWIKALRAERAHPGLDLTTPEAVRAALAPRVAGLPLAEARLAVCAEFADPARTAQLAALLADARVPDADPDAFRFTLAHADALAALYPAGFGADPFRKKAILTWLELAGFLAVRGVAVSYDLPIPADYQIPRILAWKGAIEIGPVLADALTGGALLEVTSQPVEDLRAAAVVGAHALAALAGVPDYLVDNALFTGYRKDPNFQREALPPMRCASLWF